MPRLKTVKETGTGRNTHIKDTKTGVTHKVETGIKKIEQGDYPKHHVVKPRNVKPYPRSNPDSKTKNNIDQK